MAPRSFESVVKGAQLALGEHMRLVISGRASSLLVAYLAGHENGEDRVLIAGTDPADEGVAIHQAWSWPTSYELQVRMAGEPLRSTLSPADAAALGELMADRHSKGPGPDVIQSAIVLPVQRTPSPDPYYPGSEYSHITPPPPRDPDTFMGQHIIPFRAEPAVL